MMDETTEPRWWHVYGGVVEVLGTWTTVVVGPSPLGPNDLSKTGIRVRELRIPSYGSDLTFLDSFDHEPSEREKDMFAPEEYRELDDRGDPIEPYVDVVNPLEGGGHITVRHTL